MRPLLLVVSLSFSAGTGCHASLVEPRYASWEPPSARLPAVQDRAEARRMLADSRRVWDFWRQNHTTSRREIDPKHPYTYVRAKQRAADQADFTILAVENGLVVFRTLVTLDPAELGTGGDSEVLTRAQSHWTEHGDEVGRHDAGAPAHSIDELYDQCERDVIGGPPDLSPRLFFHPSGLLMQCGFSWEDCRDCPGVSIQALGPRSVAAEPNLEGPEKWLCQTSRGLFPAEAEDPFNGQRVRCEPVVRIRPYRSPRASPVTLAAPAEEASVNDDAQSGERPKQICEIDPRACPTYEYASWFSSPLCPYGTDPPASST